MNADSRKLVDVETTGGISVLTLDRPEKRNSLAPELIRELSAALESAAGDASVSVVVITGAGESFCAGLDLGHLLELDVEGRVEYMRMAFALFRQVYTLPQPAIAAVNGPAMAGGFDLAAFCDLRMCSENARFAQTEILLGLTQIMYPLYKVIGLGHAKALALMGDAISSEEAYRIGLVSAVHPRDALLGEARRVAERMASRPRDALLESKRLSRELIEMDTDAAITRMLDRITDRLRSEEHQRALAVYAERFRRR